MTIDYFQISKCVGPCAFMFGWWKFRVTVNSVTVESTEAYPSKEDAEVAFNLLTGENK